MGRIRNPAENSGKVNLFWSVLWIQNFHGLDPGLNSFNTNSTGPRTQREAKSHNFGWCLVGGLVRCRGCFCPLPAASSPVRPGRGGTRTGRQNPGPHWPAHHHGHGTTCLKLWERKNYVTLRKRKKINIIFDCISILFVEKHMNILKFLLNFSFGHFLLLKVMTFKYHTRYCMGRYLLWYQCSNSHMDNGQ